MPTKKKKTRLGFFTRKKKNRSKQSRNTSQTRNIKQTRSKDANRVVGGNREANSPNKGSAAKKATKTRAVDPRKQTAIRKRLNQRMNFAFFILFGVMIALIGRIAYIKIELGEEYEIAVYERMTSNEKEIKAIRGSIVDRNDKILVTSSLVYNLILEPKTVLEFNQEERQRTYEGLSEYTGMDVASLEEIVKNYPTSWYRVIAREVSPEDKEMLEAKRLKGVAFEESFIRTYPKQHFAAQILGFFNGNLGQYGIEQAYNEDLEGDDGRIFPKIQGTDMIVTEVAPAKQGDSIVLTVDTIVQEYVEQTMNKYVEAYNALNAAAIIMNPHTGEIYGMYSYPYFNPNKYTTLEGILDTWGSLTQEEQSAALNQAWRNYGIQSAYEPGSTLKPVVAAMALEEDYILEEDLYECAGSSNVSGVRIRCWKTTGHGTQTLEQVLANSCNTGMIQISEKLPADIFYDYLLRFGLGSKTEIDLPGEAKGILHTEDGFGPVERATAAMGQGITVTPIQLMSAFSAVINGGYLMEPYIVSAVVDVDGNITREYGKNQKRQVLSEETADTITTYLRKTITEGTGANANIYGYTTAGKTGTAEKLPRGNGKHILSFVGYAPVENPEVIALLLFDEIPEDSGVPTRAFLEMMENILPYLGVKATDIDEESIMNTTSVVPSMEGLTIQEGITSLHSSKLNYEVIGVGSTITTQHPLGGTKLPNDSVVKIYVGTQTPDAIAEVPNLIGKTVEEARELVEGTFKIQGDTAGRISIQIPMAGTKIEQGDEIIIQTH